MASSRSPLSIALISAAVAATGCDPIMEVYMSNSSSGNLRVESFSNGDEIHGIVYLRGGDQDTRVRFGMNGPLDQTVLSDTVVYPRPNVSRLGSEIVLDVQLFRVIPPDPADPASQEELSEEGPWNGGTYVMTVALEDAASDSVIEEVEVEFKVR